MFHFVPRASLLMGARALAAGAVFLASACSDSDDDGGSTFFQVRSTSQSVAPSTPIAVSGRWIGYLADEASTADPVAMTNGSDFNGDGDTLDQIAIAIDLVAGDEFNLGVAAEEIHLVGTGALGIDVFVVVDESDDGRDWDGDAMTNDRVLLHWSPGSGLAFVDLVLDDGPASAVVVNERLYYASGVTPTGIETSLRFVEPSAPLIPIAVNTSDVDAGSNQLNHEVRLIGTDGDVLFAYSDELASGVDLNFLVDPMTQALAWDGDTDDRFVLAVLDTRSTANQLYNTGIALASASVPFRARSTAGSDYLVATLRNEAAYGQLDGLEGGFNDDQEPFAELPATWDSATSCGADTDLADDVLCWFQLDAWIANPLGNRIANTGLAGVPGAGGAVAITTGSTPFVATLQSEASQANCDLNGDSDTNDIVTRWAEASLSQSFFFGDADQIVATSVVAGGGTGLFELENVLVATVDEAADGRDHDDDPANDREALLAWLDPADGLAAAWTFDHDLSANAELYVDTDYLVSDGDAERLLLSISEDPLGSSQNTDSDTLDFIPAIASFVADIDFGVSRVALDPMRGGLVFTDDIFFYRADEAEDSRDWNGDGDMNDIVILRVGVQSGFTAYVAGVASLDRSVLAVGDDAQPVLGGAIIANEAAEGIDHNGDGDTNDFTLRYFRF